MGPALFEGLGKFTLGRIPDRIRQNPQVLDWQTECAKYMSALAKTIQRLTPVSKARKIGPIGLEFSLEALHMVQMETGADGGISLRARASVPFSGARDQLMASPRLVKSLVQKARKRGSFQGNRVVASMPVICAR